MPPQPNTQFSAGAQTLGYLYQARRALYAVLTAVEDAEIVIEGLDDIAVDDPNERLRLEQLKHHLSATATLTDSSSDLWKTIRVWSTHLKQGLFRAETTILALITTGTASAGSIAAWLRDDEQRNEVEALAGLDRVAATSENRELTSAFDAFNALTLHEKQALVRSIHIMDQSPNIVDLSAEIKSEIRYATRPQFIDGVYERLEGWWFARVVDHLVGNSSRALTHGDVHIKLASIAESFRDDSLPIDFLESLPDTVDPENDERMFVRQLREITSTKRRIEKAIVDYYRAYEQRSRWLREELLLDTDLDEYEGKLVDEWERYTLALADEEELDKENQTACKRFGVRIFNWMETDADFPIRPQVTEGYVMRGSFHILAGKQQPLIWWHPTFLDRLVEEVSV